jgi:H+/Cl- antiporter ClcA
MSERQSKEEIELELKVLKNLKDESLQVVAERRRHIDLIRGVALGLLYGIIGNLFVQFFFPVIESLELQKYDATFVPNVVICGFAIFVILATTWQFRKELTDYEEGEKTASGNLDVYRKAIQTREQKLESLKSQKEKS